MTGALWIRVDANIAGKNVVWRASEFLKMSHVTCVGHLVVFWGNVAQHTEGGFVRDTSAAQIERWADWSGEPGLFARFIREQCVTPEGNLKRWDEMQGALEDRRRKERLRKQRQREREREADSHADNPQDVTRTSRATERNETERITAPSPPPARAGEAFAERLDEATLTVVDDFLGRLPATSSPQRWIALIGGWLDGLDIRPPVPTPDDLRVGLTHYLANDERDFSPMHVRTFVERAARERTRASPTPSPQAHDGNAAGVVFDDLVRWIQDAGGYRAMTVEKLGKLPEATRQALRTIGGHKAVCDADETGRRVLRARFCKAYRPAPASCHAVAGGAQ
jgi:hypothetical protein